jgi:hypothetical protein
MAFRFYMQISEEYMPKSSGNEIPDLLYEWEKSLGFLAFQPGSGGYPF